MKELKFNAWHKEKKKMLPVISLDVKSNQALFSGSDGWISFPYLIILQFIEITSCNLKDIYVGDVVTLWKVNNETRSRYFRGVVTDHGFNGITIDSKNDYMEFGLKGYEYEKEGNIYENPELFKQ